MCQWLRFDSEEAFIPSKSHESSCGCSNAYSDFREANMKNVFTDL